jgi:acyl-CoA thioester hydrolase
MTFPYPLPALDLGAPFDRHRAAVRAEWIDGNGHMNVAYYAMAFDHGLDTFSDQLGVGWAYVEHGLGMTFVRESHIVYERELRAGDPLRITTQILDHDEKRVHLFQSMYHGGEGWLAAATELMVVHVDTGTRRSAPWPVETLRRLRAMAAAHAGLPRPEQTGRVIIIRRAAPSH